MKQANQNFQLKLKAIAIIFGAFILLGATFSALWGKGTINTPQRPIYSGQELYTAARPWVLLRTPDADDGASLDAAGFEPSADAMDWSTVVVSATNIADTEGLIDVWTELGWGVNSVTIAFFTSETDVANDDFDIGVFAWKDSAYGPAIPVYLTTADACKVGTYKCTKHPTLGTAQAAGLWVDTIDGTDCWPGGCIIADSENDRMCTLSFDLRGCRYIKAVVWNDSDGGTTAVKVGAIITGM